LLCFLSEGYRVPNSLALCLLYRSMLQTSQCIRKVTSMSWLYQKKKIFAHLTLHEIYRGSISALLLALPLATQADRVGDTEAELRALKEQVHQLQAVVEKLQHSGPTDAPVENRVRTLERRLEVAAEEAAVARQKTPTVSVNDKGLSVSSPDGNFELKLRGYLQTDARWWVTDRAQDDIDTLLVRRARPIIEGTVYKNFYYRLMPDFAGAAVSLQDAYAEWRQFPFAKVAIGKFKPPVGLERLASGSELAFVERGLPTNLVPNRDLGIMLNGDVADGVISYAAGIFNGVPDLGSIGATDTNDDKDFAGRVFIQPFLNHYGVLQGLGIGVAGTYGAEAGTASSPNLANYLTPGQARFFRYRTSSATATLPASAGGATVTVAPSATTTAFANGDRYRIAPQAYWYWRQFGMLFEYVASAQAVQIASRRESLVNHGWQIESNWVLTGEDASYRGVKPKANFDPLNGGWGAFEAVARYGELTIDNDAFRGITNTALGTAFADPRQAASAAREWAVGLNWYFNRNFKLNFDYEETSFDGGGGGSLRAPLDREIERVFLSRFQISY
jgi:phosphate-selective porin OprO/OprP